jgi:quaternary ammonium compound-resistance protein SugE
MAWLILIVAGLLEMVWAYFLKTSKGLTLPWPSVGFAVSLFASVFLHGVSLDHLPLGTAYAVWTGIGAVGTALVGILVLGESADALRLACIGLIVLGIVGLKFATKAG